MEAKSTHQNIKLQKRRIKSAAWYLMRFSILAVVVVATAIFAINLTERAAVIDAETAEIQAQIDIQMQIRQEIEDAATFVQSRAFIERMARSWHGLVHRDEITFIRVD